MKKETKRNLMLAVGLLLSFVLWTVVISFVDVQVAGPRGSSVGFATINRFVHNVTGVNMPLYVVTDWLGLVPVAFGFGFAILGLVQWIKRKNILKVDSDILVLGGFYILVLCAYLLFEEVVINYRPVLIEGYLEVSYPSSTTLLVMTVMPTAIMQLHARIKNIRFRRCVTVTLTAFTAFMVMGRLLCGVHWFTDIVGGALLSASLVMMYYSVVGLSVGNK